MKASWFHTSGRYMAGTWLHANNRFDLIAHGRGQARRETSYSFVLRAKAFELDCTQSFEIAFAKGDLETLSTVQLVSLETLDVCISFILPACDKRDASLRHWRYAVEAKLELSRLQNPLSTCTPLRCKSARTQAQLVHMQTPSVEVDQNLQLFSQTARLFSIPANCARSYA